MRQRLVAVSLGQQTLVRLRAVISVGLVEGCGDELNFPPCKSIELAQQALGGSLDTRQAGTTQSGEAYRIVERNRKYSILLGDPSGKWQTYGLNVDVPQSYGIGLHLSADSLVFSTFDGFDGPFRTN